MSAIITNNFRRNSCQRFINDVLDAGTNYFVGIGKTDKWPDNAGFTEDDSLFSVPLPNGTIMEDTDVLDNLLALVRVKNQDVLIPRNTWSSGRTYKVYNPFDPLVFDLEGSYYPCYITVNDNIYVCLGNNNNGSSTVAPGASYNTFDTSNHVVETTDGYIWAFVQNNITTSNFYTEEFIPANTDLSNVTNSKSATGGLLYGFSIEAAGTSLSGTEDIILDGVDENGDSIASINLRTDSRFNVTTAAGAIASIEYDDITTDALIGYLKGSVQVYNGVTLLDDVIIRPLIAPINGFGASPRTDLPSYYAGCYARFDGTVDGEALIDTPIRQISLIKDPQRRTTGATAGDDGAIYTDTEALDASNYIQCSATSLTQDFPAGSMIKQGSVSRFYVDKVDLLTDRIYYHTNSNNDVNYSPLNASSDITLESTDGVTTQTIPLANINSIVESEYIHNTGEVLFIDHRNKIIRNTDQTEDIKIVIQF